MEDSAHVVVLSEQPSGKEGRASQRFVPLPCGAAATRHSSFNEKLRDAGTRNGSTNGPDLFRVEWMAELDQEPSGYALTAHQIRS